MEEFFQHGLPGQIFWIQEVPCPASRSAFFRYTGDFQTNRCAVKSNFGSVNKRMIEFLRRSWAPAIESRVLERERSYRHMISERMRRVKQKDSYSALHSRLPPGTKSDKNSIVQVAAKEVQELERYKGEMERRNREIEGVLAGRRSGGETTAEEEGGGAKMIRFSFRVMADHSSGIDSMVEVLKCLKNIASRTTTIQSKFSAQELTIVLEIESPSEAAEVERAVQRTLCEVEKRKLLVDFPTEENAAQTGQMDFEYSNVNCAPDFFDQQLW